MKHQLNINRRKFVGRLWIGVGSLALGTTLLPKILKGNERSKEPGQPANPAGSKEYHVSVTGIDSNPGTISKTFLTISRAAEVAQPGDTVTVHQGIFREGINPPRGGMSDDKRIVYQAAAGEQVIIKVSEVVKGWQ